MRALTSAVFFTSTSVALVAPAFADDPATKPVFALMDNTGDGSKIELDVAAIVPTDSDANAVLFRSRLLGQYVAPNGFGGYAGISASKLVFEGDSGSPSGVGSLELGGLYQHALSPSFDLGLRVGLILPTASNNEGGLVQLASTLLARPADVATVSPETTWLRLGVSPTYHRGPVFLRADLGVDVPIIDAHGADPVEHINLGAGIGHNGFSATAEMQTLFVTNRNGGDKEVNSFHVAALSARYQGTTVSPFVSISTPLEDEFRGEVVTVTGGLTIPF